MMLYYSSSTCNITSPEAFVRHEEINLTASLGLILHYVEFCMEPGIYNGFHVTSIANVDNMILCIAHTRQYFDSRSQSYSLETSYSSKWQVRQTVIKMCVQHGLIRLANGKGTATFQAKSMGWWLPNTRRNLCRSSP